MWHIHLKLGLLMGLLTFAHPVFGGAVSPVEVVALFKERAVVRTSEGQAMVRVGETAPNGVTLLSADTRQAQVRYQGQVYTLALSSRVGTRFNQPLERVVRLNEDTIGQYRTRGKINGHYVNFLVDTGASMVALSQLQADSMGLGYGHGTLGTVHTAQGVANAYFFNLDSVTVGGITVHGVQAAVIEGSYPVEVLLGMSFLNKVRMQNQHGVLELRATR